MSDSDDKSLPPTSPAWQSVGSAAAAADDKPQSPAEDQQLEVARRFLDEDEVKTAPREKKIQFLKGKGISDRDIETLLGKTEDADTPPVSSSSPPSSQDDGDKQISEDKSVSAHNTPRAAQPPSNDRPPIVTYPEFLVKPERPPPLVTKNGIFNTLYAFAGLSTLLYGTSKYLVSPMVENLTDARTELHDLTSRKLDTLVSQLEKTVSEVPPTKSQASAGDDYSDAEDPTEMFHRDIGTQTSVSDSNALSASKGAEPTYKRQADSLSSLTKTLSVLKDQFRTQSEGFEGIKTVLDVFRDDLDGMTYGGQTEFVGGFDIYGSAKKNEPEDEIRKVRDNIRRVKGVLLSTRNFPTSTRT